MEIKAKIIGMFYQRIGEGCCYPTHLGLAYHDYYHQEGVAVLVPFNWLVRWLRDFYYFIKFPDERRKYGHYHRTSFAAGFKVGEKVGKGLTDQ